MARPKHTARAQKWQEMRMKRVNGKVSAGLWISNRRVKRYYKVAGP